MQPTKIEERQVKLLLNLLDVAKVSYDLVYPLEGKIFNVDKTEYQFIENEKYFVIGSYPLTRYAYKIKPTSVFSLEEYSFEDWYKIFGKQNMLNEDIQICLAKDIEWKAEEMFVRPLHDTKSFNGGVYNQETLKFEGMCVVASLQHISKEFRFFVLDNKIIAQSQYKQNGDLFVSSIVDDGAYDYAKKIIQKFKHEGFVIDIAYVNEKYKIVELNCFNASGFYEINLYNFLKAILDKYDA